MPFSDLPWPCRLSACCWVAFAVIALSYFLK